MLKQLLKKNVVRWSLHSPPNPCHLIWKRKQLFLWIFKWIHNNLGCNFLSFSTACQTIQKGILVTKNKFKNHILSVKCSKAINKKCFKFLRPRIKALYHVKNFHFFMKWKGCYLYHMLFAYFSKLSRIIFSWTMVIR